MTDLSRVDAADMAIKELAELTGDFQERLLAVAEFVVQHGILSDLYTGTDLARMQMLHPATTALGVFGHWSSSRGDGYDAAPLGYDDHKTSCTICPFLESVVDLVDQFDGGPCGRCRHDVAWHEVGRTLPAGEAYIVCRHGWERVEPLAAPAVEHPEQIGEAYEARWFALLTDGNFAVVTRAYYRIGSGETFQVVRDDEFLVCADPYRPGDTEIGSAGTGYTIDWATRDTRVLAVESAGPTAQEWWDNAPPFARNLLIPQEWT